MRAWKHHIGQDFIDMPELIHDNGAGKNGTIFLDYNYMLGYLWKERKHYWACELSVELDEIYRIGVFMGVMKVDKIAIGPFKPLELLAYEKHTGYREKVFAEETSERYKPDNRIIRLFPK